MRFLALALAGALAACGGSGDDGSGTTYASISVEPAFATVTVALGGTTTQPYQVFGVAGDGSKKDITSSCALAIDAEFGTFEAATAKVVAHGGKANIIAGCGEQMGSAVLAVNLVGSVVTPPAPANAPDLFNSAVATTDAARTPLIEYPLNNAVSPKNMPPIEVQYTTGGNDLFHVRLASTFINVDVYTTAPEAMLASTDWESVIGTASGDNLTVTVEGLAQASPATKYTSADTKLIVSRDNIDRTAIYYWASSAGNIMEQTFGAPTPPNLVKDGCTSCHSVNRAGSRIGYSRCVANDCNNLYTGFLKYNSTTMTWDEAVNANAMTIHGSYTTFAPIGNPFPDDTQALAIVAMANGVLALYDPDTGAPVASNISDVSTHGAGAPRTGTMPDWSPDGKHVVYASTPHPNQWIDVSDSSIALMTYENQGGAHVFGEPQFIIPNPITLPNGTYNSFFFPSFSPDGELIVFNAARSAWRNFSVAKDAGQRLMLAEKTGAWYVDLAQMNGGNVDADITWAHWAPTVGSDYYWVVFSSEQNYGHRITAANTAPACKANGVQQCKQIWIGAVAKSKLGGAMDPSAPPMWLPGQDTQTVNISPYWSVPAGLQ